MDIELAVNIIQDVGIHNDFNVNGTNNRFELYKKTIRPKYLEVKQREGDLLIYQWEDEKNDYSTNAVYTLRDVNDVIKFCTFLTISTDIRSGRNRY
jgi:uncharacterized protein YktB (UPF0637 family)